jgi:hypothetical protein
MIENIKLPRLDSLQTVQTILEEITSLSDINLAFNKLMTDFLYAKIFQLKVQNAEFEIKWGLTFDEFETESGQWENAAEYELEQEYYNWAEIITELQHYKTLQTSWK